MDDYGTTMSDVILRSIAMHPSLLAEHMRAIAKTHAAAAGAMVHDAYAANIARTMSADAIASADAGEEPPQLDGGREFAALLVDSPDSSLILLGDDEHRWSMGPRPWPTSRETDTREREVAELSGA
jgi:hypothetical protein